MNADELIKATLSSHFAAGAAGGLVRAFYIKEAYSVAAIRAVAGGISAYYVTPIILWGAPRFIEMSQTDLIAFTTPAGLFTSFIVGSMGILTSTLVEKFIKKKVGIE